VSGGGQMSDHDHESVCLLGGASWCVRLHTTSDRVRVHKTRLRISDVTAADNGVYDCRAENVAAAVNSTNSFLLSLPGTDLTPWLSSWPSVILTGLEITRT